MTDPDSESIHISTSDVKTFARWSGDRNPIHVDADAAKSSAFGGNIVHGALTVLSAFQTLDKVDGKSSALHLDIEFRDAVRPEETYPIGCRTNQIGSAETAASISIGSTEHPKVALHASWTKPAASENAKVDWASKAISSGERSSGNDSPVAWDPNDFDKEIPYYGIHQFGKHQALSDTPLTTQQELVLGLCSFIVGMKAPGLSSLFTRLEVEFPAPSDQVASNSRVANSEAGDALLYRLSFEQYEPDFRLLETQLEIADLNGCLVATAKLQSYVRFVQSPPDPNNFLQSTSDHSAEGKIALICGGSRGLGAEIAAAVGAQKYHVYIGCRKTSADVERLVEKIEQLGSTAQVLIGDAGSTAWCAGTQATLLAKHGRIDLLVLNACAPPQPASISSSSVNESTDYISQNVPLWQTPLRHFLPLVSVAEGAVVGISSSYVEETPAGFADYVAVKMAMEGAMRTASREHREVGFVIARPPKLQTSWNDTPTSAMGAIPPSFAAARIADAVCEVAHDRGVLVLDSFPYLSSNRPSKTDFAERDEQTPDLELVICASFTLDPFAESMRTWSEELQATIKFVFAPYAQVLQQSLDPNSLLSKSPNGSVILTRVSDWLREYRKDKNGDREAVEQWISQTANEHIDAIRSHRSHASSQTLLLICPSSPDAVVSQRFVRSIEERMASQLSEIPGLSVQHASEWHEAYAVQHEDISDSLREDIAHIPFTDRYYDFLSALCVRFHYRRLVPAKKVIVLDCDNTLWGGVVGEVGAAGVEFHQCHRRLHERLVCLADAGVLICLCSKNEEADVWSVFDQRDDFGLSRDQIVAASINWQPKSQNLQSLAESLNLGLDSFVFLDDNPVECAEVRSGCPEVLTIQWPLDDAEATRLLEHLWELDLHKTTAEDAKRTQLYKEEFQRRESKESASNFQEFIDSLGLVFDSRPLDKDDLPRASQLTMRTNQFNFTTVRRTETELERLSQDPHHECRTIRVRDRFGDYGLVGFFIARAAEAEFVVDTFLLSCRVLGRGVEHKMAAELGDIAAKQGFANVRWPFLPTEKNTPAKLFLQKLSPEPLVDHGTSDVEVVLDSQSLSATSFKVDEDNADAVSPNKQDAPKQATNGRPSPRPRELYLQRCAANSSVLPSRRSENGEPSESILHANVESDEVAGLVREAFSKALKQSVDQIEQVDRLDALGCDSLRIVEITVALTKLFPWLPKTLLFEHRSVSEIVQAIVDVSQAASVQPGTDARSVSITERETTSEQEVAIVGIGIHCAAGNSLADLWNLLVAGDTAVRTVPAERDSFVGTLNDTRDHFVGLVERASDFDSDFFGISPREAEYVDPQLRLLLQNAVHALEDAGAAGEGFDPSTGVFVGVMYADYARFANPYGVSQGSLYRCWEGFSLSNRLSQFLGCDGPSLSIDTACSSSATALHYACAALRRGDCSTALVNGVNLIVDPERLVQYGRLGILSPSGKCLPFGGQSDGTVLGEGAVSVVLRPLSDAQRRGDRIYAIVKGSGISSGAGSVGFTAPNPVAQSEATRMAIRSAGIDPRTVTYVETHGTGTELGDPIEVRGLEMAYCDRGLQHSDFEMHHECTIGSIKPNVGHLEAGAGLMGVVKAAMQLYHRIRVPSLTSEDPNPQIPFADLPFKIQRDRSPWRNLQARKQGQTISVPLRAGVNSFGIGGSNVHLILEESPTANESSQIENGALERPAHLLTLSAKSAEALKAQAAPWKQFLDCNDPQLVADACYSANTGRQHHDSRVALVVSPDLDWSNRLDAISNGECSSALEARDETAVRKLAFLFTGQGAQYPTMLRSLYEHHPIFRDAFDRCSKSLNPLLPKSLESVVFQGDISDREHAIHQTGFTQPALFSIQYALYQLWGSWGLSPDVMMGHSIGEVAAYCTAGGCSLEDALQLVAARGRLMQALPAGGTMASVNTDQRTVTQAITDSSLDVSIAAINGPEQVVVSGEHTKVKELLNQFEASGIQATLLSVSHAFHSSLMEPILDEFADVLDRLNLGTPHTPIVSSATGKLVHDEMTQADYWLQQARQAVRFLDAMQTLEQENATHYVELGPHPVMLAMGRQCIPDSQSRWLASARRGREDWPTILESLSGLYSDGFNVDWEGFDKPYKRSRISIPGYQFDPQTVWIDALAHNTLQLSHQCSTEESANRSDSIGYQFEWDIASRDCPPPEPVNQQWLVVCSDIEGLDRWVSTFKKRGIECLGTIISDSPVVNDPTSESGPVWSSRSAEELFDKIGDKRIGDFDRIIYVDDLGRPTPADNSEAVHESNCERSLRLAQVLKKVNVRATTERTFWLITNHSVATNAKDRVQLHSAALMGLCRVATLEYADWWGGVIDIDDWQSQQDSVFTEIQTPLCDDQVALRSGNRLVPRLRSIVESPAPAHSDEQLPFVSRLGLNRGAVLISGGLGSIGIELACWLGQGGVERIVLASRSGRPSPTTSHKIEMLRNQGVEVAIVAADVATVSGIANCRDAFEGRPICGVVHAAGLDLEKPIDELDESDFETVCAAKIAATMLLQEISQPDELKLFVTLSSISAIWGSAGRGAYAAANSFLDAFVHERRRSGLHALTVNLGPWAGSTMADPVALDKLSQIGNHGLDSSIVFRWLTELIEKDATQCVLADIDWKRFRSVMEARRPKPLFQALGNEPSTDSCNSSVSETDSSPKWAVELADTSDDQKQDVIEGLLRAEVAKLLRFKDDSKIGPTQNLFDIGMDSLTAAEFSSKIRVLAGVSDMSALLKTPTIAGLAASLVSRMDVKPNDSLGNDRMTADVDEIVGFTPSRQQAIFDFVREAWPNRRRDWIESRWKWMFLQSATRLDVDPRIWLYCDGDQVVGHHGAQFVQFQIQDQVYKTAWFVDTRVLESHREQAIGTRLTMRSREEMPFNLSLGQTEEMRTILEKLGWQPVAPLQTYLYPIRPSKVLKDKLPAIATPVASALMRMHGTAKRFRSSKAVQSVVKEVSRFDDRHDLLWDRVSQCFSCTTVRDASYLNWKYVDQPGQSFIRLEITVSGKVIAIAVLTICERDHAYNYRRAYLVDFVCSTKASDLHASIRAVVQQCEQRDVDAVFMHLINPSIEQCLIEYGFLPREPSRHLYVSFDESVDSQTLLRPEGWLITQGDSDIDRPW